MKFKINDDLKKKLMHPNAFTLYRVIAVPVLIILMLGNSFWNCFFATLVFILASITDYLDGFLARKMGLVSNFGKMMDPLADKILVSSAFIMLVAKGWVPGWVVCIIIGRELAVTGLRNLMTENNDDVSASVIAKWKTGFQIAALIPLIYHYKFIGIDMAYIGNLLIWVALVLTIISGFDYFYKARKYFIE
ncbi:MAG: CDP-diacylglycerol--glycerol-3-phosphate 3-phosphatidyltransferase [Desulforegulaceae bacterium]|nr:CDP-diacylglycerol--glycerol-3-phosphate 3-phosphatidyltransferase [Desulforegulaceae bacterium]